MATIRRDWVEGAGVRLQFLDSGGPGFPLVFLHGVMGRAVNWLPVMEALAPRFRCIAIDQRGHGRSDKPAGGYDRDAYVADLAAAADHLGLDRFAVIGHSTGALNAWVYASHHPERIAAAVLEDMHATPRAPGYLEEWRRWLDSWPLPFLSQADVRGHFSAIRRSLGDYFAELFEEHDDGWRPIFSTGAVLETLAGNEARSWLDELSRVECPALLVKGAASDELPLEEARRMAEVLPYGRLAVIAGAFHTVHRDQPAAWLAAVERFLDGVVEIVGAGAPSRREWSEAHLDVLAQEQYQHGDAGFPINPEKTALIVIDMQREFATPDGGPYFVPEAARRIPAMRRLVDAFRERRLPVIHTAFAATHQGLDRPRLGAAMPNRAPDVELDRSGLFGAPAFVPELMPLPGEVVIQKPSYGAFFDTSLETILKRLGVETVVLAGALTDCCVGATARQAYERGFGAVVASDATATSLPEMHDSELMALRRAFARVRTVDEILLELADRSTSHATASLARVAGAEARG